MYAQLKPITCIDGILLLYYTYPEGLNIAVNS